MFIINQSITQNKIPSKIKITKLLPVLKKTNFLQIITGLFQLFVSSQKYVLEKILNREIQNYLLNENIISESQLGFQQHKSTKDAFIKFVNHAFSALNSCNVILGIFIDFSKAFEIIDHKILLQKMQNLNFSV